MRRCLSLLVCAVVLESAACGSSSGGSSVSVSISPGSAQVPQGGSRAFTAAVNGSPNGQVTWSIQEPGGGTIDATGNYSAPSKAGTFHVVATSVADSRATASAAVTVPQISVTVFAANSSLGHGESTTASATVNGTVVTGVTWSVQEGAAGGTVDAAGNYVAPYTDGTFHLVATSFADPSRSASTAIAVITRQSQPTSVGPTGGQVCSPSGICLTVQPGALAQPVTFTISEAVAPAPAGALGPIHGFEPAGTIFARPATVSFPVGTSSAASIGWLVPHASAGSASAADLELLDATVSGGMLSSDVIHLGGGALLGATSSRTIVGAKLEIHHPPGIPPAFVLFDLSARTVTASTLSGTAYSAFTGHADPSGPFLVPGLPPGQFFLLDIEGLDLNWTSKHDLDKVVWLKGRADIRRWNRASATPANLTLNLTSLLPWAADDFVELASPGANLYVPALPTSPSAGATQLSTTIDLKDPQFNFGPNDGSVAAIEGSKGDRLIVLQERTLTSSTGLPYSAAVAMLRPGAFDLLEGGPATVGGAMEQLTLDQTLSCDFRVSQFEAAFQPAVPTNLPSGGAVVDLGSSVGILGNFGPNEEGALFANSDTIIFGTTSTTDLSTGTMHYALPATDQLAPFGLVRRAARISFALPGTVTPAGFFAGMDQTMDVSDLCTGPVVPVFTPVKSFQIGGHDARQPVSGVGTAPVVSWQAPELGQPVRYVLGVFRLDIAGTRTVSVPLRATYVSGGSTQVQLPAGYLSAGKKYVFTLMAEAAITGVTSDTGSTVVSNLVTP